MSNMKRVRVLSAVSIVVILIFTVLSAVGSIDIIFERFGELMAFPGEPTASKVGSNNNCFVVMVVIALLEIVMIIGKRAGYGIVLSIIRIFAMAGNIVYIAVDQTIQMGGLGANRMELTFLWYVTAAMAVIELALQIITKITSKRYSAV